MNDESAWFFAIDGAQQGPYTADQARAMIQSRTIGPETYAWRSGLQDWAPLRETELAGFLPTETLVPPAPPSPPRAEAYREDDYGEADYEAPRGRPRAAYAGAADGEELSLFGYFKRCLTEKYINLEGRARRKEYWGYVLFVWLIMFPIFLVAGFVLREQMMILYILIGIVFLAFLLPGLSVMVRRVHDIGLSGWFVLLALVPYVGSLIMLVFAVLPSQPKTNKYGPVPPGVEVKG